MRRLAAAAAALLALLSACDGEDGQDCPGAPVATLSLSGPRVPAASIAALDPVPELADCGATLEYPDPLPALHGTFASDADTGAAAFCRTNGVILFGQRSGARFTVETSTDGAVIGACGEGCAPAMRAIVSGDVTEGVDGAPATFTGVVVEVLSRPDDACGTCLLPVPGGDPAARACAARYLIEIP